MKNTVKILLIQTFLILGSISYAQNQEKVKIQIQEGENIIYKRDFIGGLFLHTQGFGGNLLYRVRKDDKKANGIQFQIATMQSWKRIKSSPTASQNAKSYVYGKKNAVFVTRLSYHYKKTMFQKRRVKGVSIDLTADAGASIAFVKPYYLQIIKDQTTGPSLIVDEPFDEEKHSISQIYGKSSAFKGVSEMKVNPGLFGKFGLFFDWSKKTDLIQGIELGVAADIYFMPIEMMAKNPKTYYFATAYVHFMFGKKFYN